MRENSLLLPDPACLLIAAKDMRHWAGLYGMLYALAPPLLRLLFRSFLHQQALYHLDQEAISSLSAPTYDPPGVLRADQLRGVTPSTMLP
jgi:hypothetical protein